MRVFFGCTSVKLLFISRISVFYQAAAGKHVETCEHLVADCHKSSEPLKSACSPSAFVKVSKQLRELDSTLDDVRLSFENSKAEQEQESYHVDNYDNLLQVWMVVLSSHGRPYIDVVNSCICNIVCGRIGYLGQTYPLPP